MACLFPGLSRQGGPRGPPGYDGCNGTMGDWLRRPPARGFLGPQRSSSACPLAAQSGGGNAGDLAFEVPAETPEKLP